MESENSSTSDDSLIINDYPSSDDSLDSIFNSSIQYYEEHNDLLLKESLKYSENNKKKTNNFDKDYFNSIKENNFEKIEKETFNEVNYQEDIVISGISGRFPDSDNVNEFAKHMYTQKTFTTTNNDIWDYTFNDKVPIKGQLKNYDTFDSSYFEINKNRGKAFNNELRFLCECVGEAIIDAGLKIEDLHNSNTGVFIGCNATEEFGAFIQDDHSDSKYTMSGCIKTMYANQIRDIFHFNGPFASIDTDNSSSLVALEWAIIAMRNKKCSSAIVAGIHTNREPNNPLIFDVQKGVNMEGKRPTFVNTKYYRTECVGVLFLQHKNNIKRIYATVYDMNTIPPPQKLNELLLPTRINYTSQNVTQNKERLERCLGETYNSALVDERNVGYVELSEYGQNVVTKFELDAIFDVLAFDRTPNNPLFVGSITTNIGHAGPASGILALIKIIICMEKNLIPPTKYMNLFPLDSLGLDSKKLKIVFECTPFIGEYAGVNSISFKNYFSHALLKKNTKEYDNDSKSIFSPKLLLYQGRSSETLIELFNEIKKHPNNDYLFQLLCEQSNMEKTKFPFRGYLIYNREDSNDVISKINLWNENIRRNIWLFFKLDNDDYIKIGKELIKIPYFDASIRYSSKYLYKKYKFNVYKFFIMDEKPNIDGNNGMLIIGMTVILALYEFLKEIGINPSGVIGYSICEILCGYSLDILTKEQILDISVLYNKLIPNTFTENSHKMALIKGDLKNLIKQYNEFNVICEVSEDCIIIISETKYIDALINNQQNEFITKNITNPFDWFFNIRNNIDEHINALKNNFKEILPFSYKKHPTWVSTTFNTYFKNRSDSELCGNYFIQSISKPIMLGNALDKVPNDSIVIILGTSDNFIRKILENELPHRCKIFQLFSNDDVNIIDKMFNEIGKMYINGCDVHLDKINPKLSYPVPRGTPMISPYWKWSKDLLWKKIDREHGNELYGDALLNKRFDENRQFNPKFSPCDPHSCCCIENNFINGPIFTFMNGDDITIYQN
ncbi:Acyl transferase domain and Beta-ketoacyl synthase, N-terminal domain and Beta-ketoacyl synthase,C-terminal domain and Acyl transferase domain and Acyl transferase/acyl hydrolase/lysophospholipase domain and Thiolase-like, subgroup domain and Thiolase-like domain and Polyketide synthase, beta-ketoacyl synthase domain-containing protein [Strongyloides ratti]|uniref:Fatty acid synthase n=1 Tax=Strongyloides ratti TaxID=34506 RepID=A0A090KQG7_STRRB|nr:Acyl transferase domain and Beta-ketoacyl synthase, N-terminal domain and Beta-ketoacyl synthase,C-terminal domain and Acyl transferase domain and Acyl transferase/acyl hydrolase/lysophospholipase domain and Thiolase-like, subgroup domain and Thiolase-like domain and Polyketide synthase, beta-ketoacyl synthase domain-containing protein [Strongyloides ratti]CEF59629.1 Acyl transferase domain and Beta-ketoacyl synthase, N-terminal domain and Beta-ketoacyl synthase,C-terminal domain and Acyl trans